MFEIETYIIPVVLMACLVVGYCIKKTTDKKTVRRWIPSIMAGLGAFLAVFVNGATLEVIVSGAVTGLASTGLYEAFRNLIENGEEGDQ